MAPMRFRHDGAIVAGSEIMGGPDQPDHDEYK
jgi:hypothetical protein